MTIAELFSPEPAENLLAALSLMPERVIYLGSRSVMTDGRIAATRAFFKGRKHPAKLLFLRVEDRDYAGAGNAIRDILEKYPDCAFEMTGGSDLLLAALGSAAARRQLQLFELEVRSQVLHALRGDLPARKEGLIRPMKGIRAGEYVQLCGGELAESSYTLSGRLPPELETDVADLWKVYIQDPEGWTKQTTILASLAARSRSGGKTVSAEVQEAPEDAFLRHLEEEKLISHVKRAGRTLTLTFRDEHVKRTLTRAGDLLELWVFLAARDEPAYFTDAVMGAKIRWHGDERRSTMNEIDGLLMYGAVPVYVSCKIGTVPKEALYEVDSVAARFGGAYAAKALVCCRLSGSPSARQALRQRARDMNILLIEDVDKLQRSPLAALLRREASEGPSVSLRSI